jgi:hypothetical protein
MNYVFGFAGLLDDDGVSHVDFSGGILGDLDETNLSDGALVGGPLYRTAWFRPTTVPNDPAKAKKFCGDKPFPSPLPAGWVDMARVDAQTVAEAIDWNRNGSTLDANFSQDINFSGDLSGRYPPPGTPPLHGFNDWASVRLDQVGSRSSQGGFSSVGGDLDVAGGDLDTAGGDLDVAGGDLDTAGGDLDTAGGDLDTAGGDLDTAGGDLDFTYAAAANMGFASPNTLKTCVLGPANCAAPPTIHRTSATWKVPVVGSDKVSLYTGYRTKGSTFSPAANVSVGTSSTTSLTDPEELPDGQQFTYSVTATFLDGTVSDYSASRHSTITAVNDPPVVVSQNYAMLWNKTLTVAAPGVLAGATDDDSSPLTQLKAVRTTQASHGIATVNPDGSFTYTPNKNFVGTDTFTFKANDGVWPGDGTTALSPNSLVAATVTIVVTKK